MPTSLLPLNYTLLLKVPDPDTLVLRYSGSVDMVLEVTEETSCIVLHSHLLQWSAASVIVNLARKGFPHPMPVAVTSVVFETLFQFAVVHLARVTPTSVGDTLTVSIAFEGTFNSGNSGGSGFFLSNNTYHPAMARRASVTTRQERERGWSRFPRHVRQPWEEAERFIVERPTDRPLMMYGTQFEESDARRAFPCLDEPGFKAHYQVTITVSGLTAGTNGTLTALTNMREAAPPVQNKTAGTTRFVFRRTLHPMSSYLVAFAVGRFDYVQQVEDGVRFRVYTPPGCAGYAGFALAFGVKVTRYYSQQWRFGYDVMRRLWNCSATFPGFVVGNAFDSPSHSLIAVVWLLPRHADVPDTPT